MGLETWVAADGVWGGNPQTLNALALVGRGQTVPLPTVSTSPGPAAIRQTPASCPRAG